MNAQRLTGEQVERLSIWRNLALQRMGYMAALLFAVQPVNSPGLGTFAVDEQWRLYVDFDAVTPTGDLRCAEALLHECGHLFNKHAQRATAARVDDTTARLWNFACDAAVNDDLVEAGCSTLAVDGVLPRLFGEPDHQSPEHYFSILRAKTPSSPASGQQRSGPARPYAGCGSGCGGPVAPGEIPAGTPGAAGVGIEDQQSALIHAAAQIRAAKARGHVPAGLADQADAVLAPPKVPWQRVLAAAVRWAGQTRPGDEDYCYRRPNRRRMTTQIAPGKRVLYPSPVTPVPRIVAVRDTSGSMSHTDLDKVTVEVEGIARRMGVRGDNLLVIDTDAAAHQTRKYHGVTTMTTVQGRGGTDMRVGIQAAAKHRPNAIVVLTDGYTPWPERRIPGMRLVACLVGADATGPVAGDVPAFIKVVSVPD